MIRRLFLTLAAAFLLIGCQPAATPENSGAPEPTPANESGEPADTTDNNDPEPAS